MNMVPQSTTKRVNSIDILRGIVMVVMALDHVRDFFSNFTYEPTDLQHASTIMFFTRWITHFCAPVFIFLAGTSAFLAMGKGKTLKQEAWRLFTRGLWLIIVEVTIVRFGWTFNVDYSLVILQVIWAIGCSMVALSALIFLPRPVILTIALVMIFGHNALDGWHPAGGMGIVWQFLHVQGPVHYGNGNTIFIIYPLIPWIGVMAAGYCFGAVFRLDARQRNKWLYSIGFGAIVLFIILRFINMYGDPSPWHTQAAWRRTLLSFVNCSKYPPSLLYLLMTLGPAITLLPLLEKMSGMPGRIFTVYGRVPMFYYILHIYLVHSMSLVVPYFYKGSAVTGLFAHPGYSLPTVYLVWLAAVALLYFPCRWFMRIKMSHRVWWLSYL